MDGDGLALRVKANGSKLWVFNYYRPHTKKRTALGFGAYSDVSLAHAVRDPNGRAYNRTAHLVDRRKMMQAWTNYLDELRGELARGSV